jgi:hypothetical protein
MAAGCGFELVDLGAIRDGDLLHVACTCREQAETCGKWLRTRIKESSPQILATG